MILELVPELRNSILSRCTTVDLVNLSCCSSAYRNIVHQHLWNTVRIPYRDLLRSNLTKDTQRVKLLKQAKNLHIHIPDFDLMDEHGKKMLLLNTQTILRNSNPKSLHTVFLPPNASAAFKDFDNLTQLCLIGYAANDMSLASVCDTLKGLKLLRVTCGVVTDNVFTCPAGPSNNCNEITDLGMSYISTIISLTELDISWARAVTNTGVESLSSLVNLRKLDVAHCGKLTNSGTSHISSISALRTLDMSFCCKVTDPAMQHISSLQTLKELNISNCRKISDLGLSYLINLSNLEVCWLILGENSRICNNIFKQFYYIY